MPDSATPAAAPSTGAGDVQPFLACIPATLLSTLRALKLEDKLAAQLQPYAAAASASAGSADGDAARAAAFAALEKKARPILLGVGAGKKGTAEILDKWRALEVDAPAGPEAASEEAHSKHATGMPTVNGGAIPAKAAAAASSKQAESNGAKPTSAVQADAPAAKPAASGSGAPKLSARERRLAKKAAAEHGSGAASGDGKGDADALASGSGNAPAPSLHASAPLIHATSQETRFYLDSIETASAEIDLKAVSISIGSAASSSSSSSSAGAAVGGAAQAGAGKQALAANATDALRELLVDAHLRLKAGVHYGLVGRNGVGKSTLLKALADRLIPGLPTNYTILLVSQVENELVAMDDDEEEQGGESTDGKRKGLSTMQAVLASDKQRNRALKEVKALSAALDGSDLGVARAVSGVVLARARAALQEAQRISLRRSGARGADARKALIAAEAALERAERSYARAHGHNQGAPAASSANGGSADATDAEAAEAREDAERDWRAEAAELYASAQAELDAHEADTAEARCEAVLRGLGFSAEQVHGPYAALSGGWKSRASLASALIKHCECLVLDECTNFLDLPSVLWLQEWLKKSEKTLVVISHDREFIDNVAEELIVLRKQQLTYFDGNLSQYEQTQRRKLKHALRQQAALDKKREHVEKSIAEAAKQARKTGDDNKLRMVKSRQKKLDERWGLERSSKGHRFKLNDLENAGYALTLRGGIDIDVPDASINFAFPDPEPLRFPGAIVHLDHVTLSYPGAKRATVKDVSLTIRPGERVALIGPNGHGKTTITKLIMERIAPSSGTVERHSKATIGLYEQHTIERFATLRAEKGKPPITALSYFISVICNVDAGEGASMEGAARRFLGALGLRGRTADAQPLHTLSGGQLVRLGLAELMWQAPDLIVLDEVTQHLDSDSIDALIRALNRYAGAILLISHDRHAVKELIEGKKSEVAGADSDADDDDDSDDSEGSVDGAAREPGRVYLVREGRARLLEGGMDAYSSQVEKDIEA